MKKRKRDRNRRWLVLLVVIAVLGWLGNRTLSQINALLKPHVEKVAASEVRNAASAVIKRAVDSLQLETGDLIRIERDTQGNITDIIYDTQQMNDLMSRSLDAAQESLNAAAEGETDPHTHLVYYDKGIIYSLPVGMLTGSVLLANLGPSIDIRMRAVNSLVGQIDAVSTAYGINSTLLEIDLKISVEMLVISPFLLDPQQIEVKIPLVMQNVQGQIPQLMVGQLA